jgi:hypothetical protein
MLPGEACGSASPGTGIDFIRLPEPSKRPQDARKRLAATG